jgi:[ribosomal protein S18]-alanine N-acetyltransferase
MDEKAFLIIRKVKPEDINTILKIEEEAFPKTAYSKQTFINYEIHLPDTFLVIELENTIIGYIIFDRDGYIHSTSIKYQYRKKGFGKMLFMYAIKSVQKRLWLEVRSKNSGAIAFYERLGMKITGRISNYYGDDDALIMVMSQKKSD